MPSRYRLSTGALIALLAVGAWCLSNLWAATHPWFPDAVSESLNLRYSLHASAALADALSGTPSEFQLSYQGFPYGPLLFVTGGGLELLLGRAPWVRLLPVQLCALLTLLGVGLVAARLTGRRSAGMWAAGAMAVMPMWVYYCRHFTTDVAISAFVVLAAWFALASEGWTKWRAVAGFGLCFGLGLLCKATIVHFLALPLIWHGAVTVLRGTPFPGDPSDASGAAPAASTLRSRCVSALPRVLAGIVLAAVTAWPYYRHFGEAQPRDLLEGHELGPLQTWGIVPEHAYPRFGGERWLDWLLFFPRMLVEYQLGLPLAVLLLGAGVYAAVRSGRGGRWALGGFVWGIVLCCLLIHKKWYYTLPALPFLAIAAGMGVDALIADVRSRWGSTPARGVGALAILVLAGTWLGACWLGGSGPLFNDPRLLLLGPALEDTAQPQWLDLLAAQSTAGAHGDVVVLSEQPFKNALGPDFQSVRALLNQLSYGLESQGLSPRLMPVESWEALDGYLPDADFVIFVGSEGRPWFGPHARFFREPDGEPIPQAKAEVSALGARLDTLDTQLVGPWTLRLAQIRSSAPAPD